MRRRIVPYPGWNAVGCGGWKNGGREQQAERMEGPASQHRGMDGEREGGMDDG